MLENQVQPRDDGAESHFTLAERRNASRQPVIKSAKIVCGAGLGQGVFNCLVLDESPAGVLVDLGAMFSLPEQMMLHMTGGASYKARRCWAAGTKMGLEFVGPQMLSAEAVQMLSELGKLMKSQGLPAIMAVLRTQQFFANEEVRKAAEEAEAAYHRLELVLQG